MRLISVILMLFLVLAASNCSKPPEEPIPPENPPSVEPVPTHDPVPGPVDPEPTPDPGPDPDPEPFPVPDPEPIPDPEPTPIPLDPSQTFKLNVTFFGSMATDARIAKYKASMAVLKKVIALPEFKQRILNYDSSCTTNTFYQTIKSNNAIYGHILDGNETLQPLKDNELDVEVEFYYSFTNTVGYTYGSSKRIWVNTKYFDSYKYSSVAANLMHEWLHKLGYKHDSASTPCRPYSVPYGIGSIVRELGINVQQ